MAELTQDAVLIVAGLDVVRIDGERARIAFERIVGPVETFQDRAAIVVRLQRFRIERQRPVEALERFVELAEQAERVSLVV